MPRCDLCPVPPYLACPDEGWHCRAMANGGEALADQVRQLADSPRPRRAPLPPAVLADLCPCGSGPCGCGSEPRVCSHPDRPIHVWRSLCLQCAPDLFFNQEPP